MRATLSLVAGLFAYFAACVGTAQAQDGQWTLMESAGPVFVAQPLVAPRFVSLREQLAPGSTLTTGGNGRAVVRRGAQAITIGPNSRITLPVAEPSGMTKIIQDFGAAMFKVDKRGIQHFEVDTPIIAAVVKGTTFTVSVGANNHSVHVVEGLVQVSAHSSGSAVPVPAGVTALVSINNPGMIRLVNPSTGAGDARRGQPVDIAPAESSQRRAEAAGTGVVASLAVPQAIGAEPLDIRRLSDGVIGSSSAPAQRVDIGNVPTDGRKTEGNSNGGLEGQTDVLLSADSGLRETAIGGAVENTVATVSAEVSPVVSVVAAPSPVEKVEPVVSVLPVDSPVENGNGNVNLGAPVVTSTADNSVGSVMPSGSSVDSTLANPNDSGVLGAILSRIAAPGGK